MRPSLPWLIAAILLGGLQAAGADPAAPIAVAASAVHRAKIEAYLRARTAYEKEASAYWRQIGEKRSARFAKRRNDEPIGLDDYVLTQPPIYIGPPRPPGVTAPQPEPSEPRPPIPTLADFLRHAAEQFQFVPDRPRTEVEFKQAYARAASAAGLTRAQAVRVYAFETGGNGTYDGQAGLASAGGRKGGRPISPAVGYNQLLSTNTVSLLAEHGDRFVASLMQSAQALSGAERSRLEQKAAALKRVIAYCRSVPGKWSEQDKLAKFTPGGIGAHAAVLDRDIGPLLQTQKLLDSILFARAKGLQRPLTAAELELMNFTGDGNGFDIVMMPRGLRERVPTSNFFQRNGYERNPIARRTGTVAALVASVETKMDQGSQAPGARELAAAF